MVFYFTPFLFFLLPIVLGVYLSTFSEYALNLLVTEKGLIELLSVWLLFASVGLGLGRAFFERGVRLFWLQTSYLFFVFGLRELDLHRTHLNESMLRVSFFFDPQYSLYFRFFILAILVVFVYFIFRLFQKNKAFLIRSFQDRSYWLLFFICGTLCMAAAVLSEKLLQNTLELLPIEINAGLVEGNFEEAFEFFSYVFLFVAYWMLKRPLENWYFRSSLES